MCFKESFGKTELSGSLWCSQSIESSKCRSANSPSAITVYLTLMLCFRVWMNVLLTQDIYFFFLIPKFIFISILNNVTISYRIGQVLGNRFRSESMGKICLVKISRAKKEKRTPKRNSWLTIANNLQSLEVMSQYVNWGESQKPLNKPWFLKLCKIVCAS